MTQAKGSQRKYSDRLAATAAARLRADGFQVAFGRSSHPAALIRPRLIDCPALSVSAVPTATPCLASVALVERARNHVIVESMITTAPRADRETTLSALGSALVLAVTPRRSRSEGSDTAPPGVAGQDPSADLLRFAGTTIDLRRITHVHDPVTDPDVPQIHRYHTG